MQEMLEIKWIKRHVTWLKHSGKSRLFTLIDSTKLHHAICITSFLKQRSKSIDPKSKSGFTIFLIDNPFKHEYMSTEYMKVTANDSGTGFERMGRKIANDSLHASVVSLKVQSSRKLHLNILPIRHTIVYAFLCIRMQYLFNGKF